MTMRTTGSLWPRALLRTVPFALVLLAGLLMVNAAQVPRTPGRADTSFLGLTFFSSTRESLAGGGSAVTLQPGLGALVVLGLAVVAAAVLVRRAKRRWAARK